MLHSQYTHLAGSRSKDHDKLRAFYKANKIGANLISGRGAIFQRMGAMHSMTRPHQVITP